MDYALLRLALLKKLHDYIEQLIDASTRDWQAAIQSRNEDTKSSAGDKHETNRAMMQAEIDKAETQLLRYKQFKSELENIKGKTPCKTIQTGSLIITPTEGYFIGIPLGKHSIVGFDVYCISAVSPIGKELVGKKTGDKVKFNNRTILIEHIS